MRETEHWREVPCPPELAALWRRQFGPDAQLPNLWRHKALEFQAMHTRDPVPGENALGPRHHISVAGRTELAPWDVLANAGHEIRPGVPFVIGVPPKSWWINVHEYTLHLWESRDSVLIDLWRAERKGDRPS